MQRLIIGFLLLAYIQGFSQTYDPRKAAAYASRWCYDKNPEYNWYGFDPPYNGDCANFVSQCLIAGGWDLSLGAYGVPGGTGEVDNKGCIKGAKELVMHLEKYKKDQITPRVYTTGYDPPTHHDVGDPMFTLKLNGDPGHSYICSSLGINARRLHSAHTEDRCDEDMSTVFGSNAKLIYFHIKSAYPDNCDCECGDPCPPCEHAPKQKHITTATTNLPSEVRAIEKITAGNAAVKVLSGQNVSFITAGTIELLPGFEVQAGGNFNTQIKGNILGVTADCNEYCEPVIYTGYHRWCTYYPWPGTNNFLVEAANVLKIYLAVYRGYWYNYNVGEFIYSNVVENQEGKVVLWDLIEGESPEYLQPDDVYHFYWAYLRFYPCEWGGEKYWDYWEQFVVKNHPTAHDKLPNELDRMNQILHMDIDNIMYPEINTTSNFIIIPNPNPGTFHLQTNFPVTDIAHLKIINSIGATLYETQTLSSYTIQLPTSATGQHFVVIILKDGAVLTQKMMIQR